MEQKKNYNIRYEEWKKTIPIEITSDVTWKIKAYRLSLYLDHLCWHDSSRIFQQKRYSLGDQLYRSVSSISANIVEGYSRISVKEKVRFLEYALGSAREGRDWYLKSIHILSSDTSIDRIQQLTDIIKLLQRMITDQRSKIQSK